MILKNGVKFDSKHSIDDWDLLLISKEIGTPSPKIITVEIPGGDGVKDLSECFGEIKYNNRTLIFNFDMFQNSSEWINLYSEICNYVNGQKRKIILDTDSNFFYIGRCAVTNFTNDFTVAHITIECDCEPWKYKKEKTIITKNVVVGQEYNFKNLYKKVIPKITVESNLNFVFNGTSYSIGPGTHIILDICLEEGNNFFEITEGEGNLTLEYQEATL